MASAPSNESNEQMQRYEYLNKMGFAKLLISMGEMSKAAKVLRVLADDLENKAQEPARPTVERMPKGPHFDEESIRRAAESMMRNYRMDRNFK